jgi:hypothetical protein
MEEKLEKKNLNLPETTSSDWDNLNIARISTFWRLVALYGSTQDIIVETKPWTEEKLRQHLKALNDKEK